MESGSTEMGVNAGTLLTAVAVTAKELAVLGVYSVGARLRGWMFSVLSNRLASAVGRSVGCSAQTPSLRGVLSADVACSPTRTAFLPHTHTHTPCGWWVGGVCALCKLCVDTISRRASHVAANGSAKRLSDHGREGQSETEAR